MSIPYDDRYNNWHKSPTDRERTLEEYRLLCAAATNDEVFDTYVTLVGGDDYDGCCTWGGGIMLQAAEDETFKRLREIGFLKDAV